MKLKGVVLALALTAAGPVYAACSTAGSVIAFTGSALRDMNNLQTSFRSIVVTPVMMQVNISFANMQNAIAARDAQVLQAIYETSILATKNKADIDKVNAELQATYTLALQHDLDRFNNQILLDDGLPKGPSELYFRNLCKEDKIKQASFGRAGMLSRKDILKESLAINEVRAQEVKDSRAIARDAQNHHFDNYCSTRDVENGMCEEASEIPYADIKASVAVHPMNSSDSLLADGGYFTRFTYSDFEERAARDYYDNILRLGSLRRPTASAGQTSPQVLAAHNRLQSALSLSNYTFTYSMNNRIPTAKVEGVDVSRLDQLYYLINSKAQQFAESGSTQTDKGMKLELLNQYAMKNLLEREKAAYQEQINNLTAALIALRENSPDRIEYIEGQR